jgi:hypothetical protein
MRNPVKPRMLAACAFVLMAFSARDGSAGSGPDTLDLPRAERYLQEFDSLCRKDGGRLWGVSLCGPMLLVDSGTRQAVGNERDGSGLLQPRDGVFAGSLPVDVGIANTAVEWSGKRWTMILWYSLDEDPRDRRRLLAHEAFHRIQPELHLDPAGELNDHLDTEDGRIWLQEEWNALQMALLSKGKDRRRAVEDALTFRAARRDRFPSAAAREIPLEIFEGLAEYSGMRLAGFSREQVVEAVKRKRKGETGLVRSFAYVSGPLYGFLLDGTGAGWRKEVKSDTDLGALLGGRLQASPGPPAEAEGRSGSYGGAALRSSEDQRERDRQARLAAWRASLIDGPVLVLDLKSVTSGSFDPGKVFPFGENQTVYGSRELIAVWGRLNVEGGAILENRSSREAHVSLKGAAPDLSRGEGWSLQLETGWEVAPGERPGDYVVRKKGSGNGESVGRGSP